MRAYAAVHIERIPILLPCPSIYPSGQHYYEYYSMAVRQHGHDHGRENCLCCAPLTTESSTETLPSAVSPS